MKEASIKQKEQLHKAFKIAVEDKQLFDAFLRDLLTPYEYNDVHTRFALVSMLYSGSTHRGVSDALKIGVATVNRGALELKDKQGGFALILKKMSK